VQDHNAPSVAQTLVGRQNEKDRSDNPCDPEANKDFCDLRERFSDLHIENQNTTLFKESLARFRR